MKYHFKKSGTCFDVYIFKDFVVKIPKTTTFKAKVHSIAEAQRELSEKVDGIFPAFTIGGKLFTRRILGRCLLEFSRDFQKKIMVQAKEKVKEIDKAGFILKDVVPQNIIYNGRDFFIVDFSHLTKKSPCKFSRMLEEI